MFFLHAHPPQIYIQPQSTSGPFRRLLPPSNGQSPAEVMQRIRPDPCPTPPTPTFPPPPQTEKFLMMQTQTHGGCTEKRVLVYTLASSAPSLITRYSYTVVLAYRSLGKPAFLVFFATGYCFSTNGISVSMVTGRGADLYKSLRLLLRLFSALE